MTLFAYASSFDGIFDDVSVEMWFSQESFMVFWNKPSDFTKPQKKISHDVEWDEIVH